MANLNSIKNHEQNYVVRDSQNPKQYMKQIEVNNTFDIR